MRTYHVGLYVPTDTTIQDAMNGGKVVVQCREDIDCLSCELWKYHGEHITTKAHLHEIRHQLLAAINADNGTNFSRIEID